MNIEDINPLEDDWDTSMLEKFSKKQLILALHRSLNDVYDSFNAKGLAKLGRLFFNSIIEEIEKRL